MTVYPIHKNPVWFAAVPIWAWVVGGATVTTVAVAGNEYRKIGVENERVRDVPLLIEELEAAFVALGQGTQVTTSRTTTAVLPPTSEKVAWLQAATAYRDAANQVLKEGGSASDAAELVSWGQSALDTAKSKPDDTTISASDDRLKTPLAEASQNIAKYGSGMTRIVANVLGNQDAKLIGEIQADIAARQPSKQIGDAMKKTAGEIFVPFAVMAGLVTGKKPLGMTDLQWNVIRFSLYGVIGMGVVGYAASKVSEVGELVDGD